MFIEIWLLDVFTGLDWASIGGSGIFLNGLDFSFFSFSLGLISFHQGFQLKIPVSHVSWLGIFVRRHVVDVPAFGLTKLSDKNTVFESMQVDIVII